MRSVVSVRQFVSPLFFKQKLTLALDFFLHVNGTQVKVGITTICRPIGSVHSND